MNAKQLGRELYRGVKSYRLAKRQIRERLMERPAKQADELSDEERLSAKGAQWDLLQLAMFDHYSRLAMADRMIFESEHPDGKPIATHGWLVVHELNLTQLVVDTLRSTHLRWVRRQDGCYVQLGDNSRRIEELTEQLITLTRQANTLTREASSTS